MANLSVRNIEESVYERLRLRAAGHGVSMEEEVRRLIRAAVAAPPDLAQFATDYFGMSHGVDLDLIAAEPHDPIDLG